MGLDAYRVFELIRDNSSLATVGQFLARHDQPKSASSWDEAWQRRVKPALDSRAITVAHLLDLLRDVEEYGRQHVFLYSCDRSIASDLLSEKRLHRYPELVERHKNPLVPDKPQRLTLAEVRLEPGRELVLKAVETRESRVLESEGRKGRHYIKTYEFREERAVSVACLRGDGLLQVRVQSQRNSSDYGAPLRMVWQLVKQAFPPEDFSDLLLRKVRDRLWHDRDELWKQVRFTDSILRNPNGTRISAASRGRQDDLLDDPGASDGLDAFLAKSGYFDSSNFWFRAGENGRPGPARDVHVLLSGRANEFAIPASCTKGDYEHVLQRLRGLNQ